MKLRAFGLAILFIASFDLSAKAGGVCLPLLLTIDDSNPCAVTITATGSDAAIFDCSSNESQGVDLLRLFTSPVEVADPTGCGTLIPSGGCLAYNSFIPSDASGCDVDLNLYSSACNASDITQRFSTCSSAFTGTWTIDLSQFACELPCVGASGDIIVGNGCGGSGDTLGLWEIVDAPVPEPSQYGFFISLALIGLIGFRRFSAARRQGA